MSETLCDLVSRYHFDFISHFAHSPCSSHTGLFVSHTKNTHTTTSGSPYFLVLRLKHSSPTYLYGSLSSNLPQEICLNITSSERFSLIFLYNMPPSPIMLYLPLFYFSSQQISPADILYVYVLLVSTTELLSSQEQGFHLFCSMLYFQYVK